MNVVDPFQAAMEAEPIQRSVYFGQVLADAWHCVLVKGEGKVPFNPELHPADQRRTAVKIAIDVRGRDGNVFTIEREMIAESHDWAKIVKPSLRQLGIDLRSINGKWARVRMVPTGRTYTDADGKERQATTFQFEAVYQTQAECEAAERAYWSQNQSENPENGSTAPANGNGATRQTALKFVPALWAAANRDLDRFAELLAKNSLTAQLHVDDPDVLEIISR